MFLLKIKYNKKVLKKFLKNVIIFLERIKIIERKKYEKYVYVFDI